MAKDSRYPQDVPKAFELKHEPNLSRHHPEDVARLRALCAEMKKRIQEEVHDKEFGDIDRLVFSTFRLAHKLEFRNPPVEHIRYERGKTPESRRRTFGWGQLPSLWPVHALPHIMHVFGYRLHNPSSSYMGGPLQVITAVVAENNSPSGPMFGAVDTGSKTTQRAEAFVILNRWVELLDQCAMPRNVPPEEINVNLEHIAFFASSNMSPVSTKTVEAVRRVISDWDGTNKAAVYQFLRNAHRSTEELDQMNEVDVRMAFATFPVSETYHTAVHSVQKLVIEEWSIPMSKKTISGHLCITTKQLNQAVAAGAYKLDKIGEELWRIRLNDLPRAVRDLFLPPKI